MEPEDLLAMGNDVTPPGAEELRRIVARAGRRRLRAAAGGVTVALLVGGGAGYALSNHSSPGQTVATAPAATSDGGSQAPLSSSAASAAPNLSSGASPAQRLTLLFTRTAGSIDIRFFENPSNALPADYAAASDCAIGLPSYEAEVSTSKMVGTAFSAFPNNGHSKALSDVDTAIVGVAEGDPVLVVTAATGPGVTQVTETGFTGGATDSMAPVKGLVALAGPTSAPSSASLRSPLKLGTLTALNASGKVLASESVTWPLIPDAAPLTACAGGGTIGPGRAACYSSGGTKSVAPATAPGTGTGLSPSVLCRPPVFCGSASPASGGSCMGAQCSNPAIRDVPGSAAGSSGVVNGRAELACPVTKAASTKAAG
jgi:hypothetical protein